MTSRRKFIYEHSAKLAWKQFKSNVGLAADRETNVGHGTDSFKELPQSAGFIETPVK